MSLWTGLILFVFNPLCMNVCVFISVWPRVGAEADPDAGASSDL